jgi:very-short-patch-repair endonuclease
VRTHRTDSLSPADAAVRHGIPVTSACRTIIDCAAASPPRRLGEMLDDARRRRLVRLGEVARRVDELATSGRHGITAMREALADRGAPPASVFESRVARLLHGAQLPRAERNWRVDLDGETYFLDFAFPDRKVCIEADSEAFHLDLASFRRDRQRQNVLVLHGWTVIRFTWADVRGPSARIMYSFQSLRLMTGPSAFMSEGDRTLSRRDSS